MPPVIKKEEVPTHHLEFDKRVALAAKEASSIRRSVKIWGILTTLGALSSIILLILHLWFKK